jgi:hypothetical protein
MPNLCEAINGLVEQRLPQAIETGETINVPDLASEITESLADLIVCSARRSKIGPQPIKPLLPPLSRSKP